MKKYILIFTIFTFFTIYGNVKNDTISKFTFEKIVFLPLIEEDCDACGCSTNAGGMGFGSVLDKNFVGVRYLYQNYKSRNGIFNNSPWVNENFNTMQIWSKIPITKRWQITTLVPYQFHNRVLDFGNEQISGLGDITALTSYKIIKTEKETTAFNHLFELSMGLKMPTGKFNATNNLGTVNQSFQTGTGSWDGVFVAEYTLTKKQFGINATANYMLKGINPKQYHFGNQFNYASNLFYIVNLPQLKLVPQIGISGEVYKENEQFLQTINNTGGQVLFSKLGFEIEKNNFTFGMSTLAPVNQNLSNGKVIANYRIGVSLNYNL